MSDITKHPGGRPPAVIDLEIVRRAGQLHCTAAEAAMLCGVNRDTFFEHLKRDPEFRAAWEEGNANGKQALRRLQWQACEAGNTGMMIWLGKQWLGQKDRNEVSGDPERPVYVVRAPAQSENHEEWLKTYAPVGAQIDGEAIEVDD